MLGWLGCVGCANPLPPTPEQSESSGTGTMTIVSAEGDATAEAVGTGTMTTVSTEGDATAEAVDSSTTGPVAECGNGDVEDGEDCDGADWNGATCESLGFSETGLMCVGCQFTVSECGPPPGMVKVPGGTFEMGSNSESEEQPIRMVQVDTFWIDETEVTVEAYAACVDSGACSEPVPRDTDCNWTIAGREGHPVNCVTWFQAEAYCGWADLGTKRLPTEAEWEKAVRGTDARRYPWGDAPLPSCAHVVMNDAAAGGAGCGMGSTWPVGSKPMGDSPYGAHDMAGNAREWVADWYASSYDAKETDNPTGPAMGAERVVRGGSWSASVTDLFRSAFRYSFSPTLVSDMMGFRCARTPPAAL